jgi:hypothetical protein
MEPGLCLHPETLGPHPVGQWLATVGNGTLWRRQTESEMVPVLQELLATWGGDSGLAGTGGRLGQSGQSAAGERRILGGGPGILAGCLVS